MIYKIQTSIFTNASQIDNFRLLLSEFEKLQNKNSIEAIESIIPFFEGKSIKISDVNIKICQEIANKLKFEPFQQISVVFNKYKNQRKIVEEYTKIQLLLSDINENNFESTKFQIIQSTLEKESKYRNLLIDLIIYFSKIRPIKTKFYVQLTEALIQHKKNQNNQLNSPRLTTRSSTRIQSNPETASEYSNYIINDFKNEKLKHLFSPVFLYQIFKSSIITSNKQKKIILAIINDSNDDELKEWFKPSFKLLNKEELDLFNKNAQKLNEEPIREMIRADNISELKKFLSSPNKYNSQYLDKHILNNTVVFDYYVKSKPIYLTEYAAYFKAQNCFTWLVSNNFKSSQNLVYKAIAGGNIDIFNNILTGQNVRIDQQNAIRKSIKYHQNQFFELLVDNPKYQFISESPETCIHFYNIAAFLRTKYSNFNFVFELIDYHNVVLIEALLPYLHSFNVFIMTFYAIVNQSNEIAKLLFESFDEIKYPLYYLKQLQSSIDDQTKYNFNSIIQSSQKEKFDKLIVCIEFCLISDNLEFLKYLISRSSNVKDSLFKSLLSFSQVPKISLTKCLKYLFSFVFNSFSGDQIFLLFNNFKIANQSNILLHIFDEMNKANIKLSNSQMDSILQILLQNSNCRTSIFKNYPIPIKILTTYLQEENDLNAYVELLSCEKVNINIVMKMYLAKLCQKSVNMSNIRMNEKEFIGHCSTHPTFKVDFELDEDKNSYLHYIALHKEIEYIYQFIFTYPSFKKILNKVNKSNKTPLIVAIEHQNVKAARILMEQSGISILNKDFDEMDAFDYAIQNNLIQIVLYILEQFGTDELLNGISRTRRISPIACSETKEMIELLLSSGVSSVNGVDKNGNTLLVKSLQNKCDFDFQYVLYNIPGIDLNAQCENGKTLFMAAIELGQYNSIIDHITQNPLPKIEISKERKSSLSHSQPIPSSSLSSNRNRSAASSSLSKSLLHNKPKIVTLSKSNSLNRNKSSLGQSNPTSRANSSIGQQNSQKRTKSSLSNQPLAPLNDSKPEIEESQCNNISILDKIDYKKCSKENSYLASAIISNDANLISKFLTVSIKEGNNQASLIAAMKNPNSNSLVPKLMKAKIELTPFQVVEEIPQIPEKFYSNLLKQEKQPQKAFNYSYNDKTILMVSILNHNSALFKFLISNKEIMKLNFNWTNSQGLNCFDSAIQQQNKDFVDLLFAEPKLNKSFDSFVSIIVKRNKFSNSLKLDETIKAQWISEILKKKNEIFGIIVDNNNVELFDLIINDINEENLINQAFAKSISKRYEKIMNKLLDNKLLNPEFVVEKVIENSNVSLLKSLFKKYSKIVKFDKFVELVCNANQGIKDAFLNYAPISNYSKDLVQNKCDLNYNLQNVNYLLNFV